MGIAFKLLCQKCKVGDYVIITCSTGTTEGRIMEIAEHEVAIETADGFSCIGESDIKSIRTISAVVPQQPAQPTSSTVAPAAIQQPLPPIEQSSESQSPQSEPLQPVQKPMTRPH